MEIMDVHSVFNGIVAILVGCPVRHPAFDAASSHPHGVAVRVVIAAVSSLGDRRPAKFASPEDQRVVEHTSGFQILQKTCNRQVHFSSVLGVQTDQFAVLVPFITVRALDEANSALGQAAGHQALPAENLEMTTTVVRGGGCKDVLGLQHCGIAPERRT